MHPIAKKIENNVNFGNIGIKKMKKIFLFLSLSVFNCIAQDKIITIKSDTISTKITSLENQKVIYFLELDKDKKLVEIPFVNLHKIIWRNGLEYIINKDLEEKLKSKPTPKSEEKIKEVVIEKVEKETANQFLNAPVLTVKTRFFLGRIYKINTLKVRANELEKVLKYYDSENYYTYKKGNNMRKIGYLFNSTAYLAAVLTEEINNKKNFQNANKLYSNAIGVMIVSGISFYIGQGFMRKAVKNYEYNRKISNNYIDYDKKNKETKRIKSSK